MFAGKWINRVVITAVDEVERPQPGGAGCGCPSRIVGFHTPAGSANGERNPALTKLKRGVVPQHYHSVITSLATVPSPRISVTEKCLAKRLQDCNDPASLLQEADSCGIEASAVYEVD